MYKKGNTSIHPLVLQISGTNIERVHLNFLNLTLHKDFNWKEHVDNISNKCSRIIGILNIKTVIVNTREINVI